MQTDRLGRGDAFGDLAIMTGEAHFATYRAAAQGKQQQPVKMLIMQRTVFEHYMDLAVVAGAKVSSEYCIIHVTEDMY